MWLNVSSSNRNPHVTLKYYLNCVDEIGGWYSIILDI